MVPVDALRGFQEQCQDEQSACRRPAPLCDRLTAARQCWRMGLAEDRVAVIPTRRADTDGYQEPDVVLFHSRLTGDRFKQEICFNRRLCYEFVIFQKAVEWLFSVCRCAPYPKRVYHRICGITVATACLLPTIRDR